MAEQELDGPQVLRPAVVSVDLPRPSLHLGGGEVLVAAVDGLKLLPAIATSTPTDNASADLTNPYFLSATRKD